MQKIYDYYDEIFNKGYLAEREEYKERVSKDKQIIRPSSLGYCMRWKYWEYLEKEIDKDYVSVYNKDVPLWIGSLIHEQLERWCKKGGSNLFVEQSVEWNGIHGSTDLIAKPEGEYVVTDYKGHGGGREVKCKCGQYVADKGAYWYSFNDMKKGKLSGKTEKQVTFYATAANKTLGLDIKNGMIMHFSRDFSYEFKKFFQSFKIRQSIIDDNKKYIDTIVDCVAKDITPEAKPYDDFECFYFRKGEKVRVCPYLNQCKQNKL